MRSLLNAKGLLGLTAVAALAGAFALGFWLSKGAGSSAPAPAPATVEATQGSVEDTITATATLTWPTLTEVDLVGTGRVTRSLPTGEVQAGQSLVYLDEAPVHVLAGIVPVYRDLKPGDKGEDVKQLQRFLASRSTTAATVTAAVGVDGDYGATTAAAVRQWNTARGCACGDTVPAASIVVVPELPTRVKAADGFRVGAAPPTPAVVVTGRTPTAAVSLTPGDAERLPKAATVTLTLPGGAAIVATSGPGRAAEQGGVPVPLDVTTLDCTALACPGPVEAGPKGAVIPALVTITAKTEGVVIPVGAVGIGADNATYVSLLDGTRKAVTVGARAKGLAVVDGLPAGTRVVAKAEK